MCSTTLVALASDSKETEEKNNNTAIIEQALALDETIKLSDKAFTVISMVEEDVGYSTRGQSNLAIQSINETNGIVEVTTIHPYKVTKDNELVNSFDYIAGKTRAGGEYTFPLVDTTVTVKVYYYDTGLSYVNLFSFYRPLGVQAYWSSNNSTVSVSKLNVKFDSMGDLHRYPECMSQNMNTTLIQEDYQHINKINVNNPLKNQIHVSTDAMMDSERVLCFTDGFNHGGIVRVEATYKVNGVNRTYGHSYDAYL